jgi:hypothetical protein
MINFCEGLLELTFALYAYFRPKEFPDTAITPDFVKNLVEK